MNLDDKYRICLDQAMTLVLVLVDKQQISTASTVALASAVNTIANELMLKWK